MTSAYSRSASEPRDRRGYPRERNSGGSSFWNARNVDADSWRRDPSSVPAPPRDRSRTRMERPPSRGSTGDYRRDHQNGSGKYSSRRGRPRGDANGRGSYSRGYYQRSGYGPPSGQGTQYFSPLTSPPPPDTTKFNAAEALELFAHRWQIISNEINDKSIPDDQKPEIYKVDTGSTSVWGQPRVHVQAAVTDFLVELKAAIERDHKSQTEAETEPSQHSDA